jgi:hypothetical protein
MYRTSPPLPQVSNPISPSPNTTGELSDAKVAELRTRGWGDDEIRRLIKARTGRSPAPKPQPKTAQGQFASPFASPIPATYQNRNYDLDEKYDLGDGPNGPVE